MRSDTRTISIDAAPQSVFQFVADPQNLPRWAVGFAKKVARNGDRWIVTTGDGEVSLRIAADEQTGVVDFYMTFGSGLDAVAASRVIQRGDRTEYVFTQFQPPHMSDELFFMNVRTVV